MFQADPTITDLNVRDRNIAKVLFSMNISQVATPELSMEDAKCYIFFFREGNRLSAFILLYLPRTDRRFYYSYSLNPFPEESMPEVEDEARRFLEDMGFLLDEINFSGLSSAEKDKWISGQEVFGKRKPAQAAQMPSIQEHTAGAAQAEAPRPVRPEDVLARAVRLGVVKPPGQPAQAVGPLVEKDKEALARLLASF